MIREKPRPSGTRPTVSVVVPCYNYGRYLRDCVASVLSQQGVEVDVLIVDDASPDGSVAVARELAAADPRVRVIEHLTNQGHIATYNGGLAKASGEYCVLLSADDLLSPGSLARSTDLLQAHPEVGFVYGFSHSFAVAPPQPRPRTRSWSVWTGPEWLTENSVRGTNPICTPEVVMRTSLMRELEYDSRVPHAADFLVWLRAAARAGVGRVNGVDQAFYRVHGTNMHATEFAGMYRDITERAASFDIAFGTEEAAWTAGLTHLRDAAKRALAREALVTAIRAYRLESDDAEDPRPLAELAERIWPASRSWLLRRRYARYARRASVQQRLPLPVRRFAWRAEHHARWQLWRLRGYRV